MFWLVLLYAVIKRKLFHQRYMVEDSTNLNISRAWNPVSIKKTYGISNCFSSILHIPIYKQTLSDNEITREKEFIGSIANK